MVVIAKRDEAEGLQRGVAGSANWAEHFGHPSDRATLYLEGNLDKVALTQGSGKPQQATRYRNGLEFSFGALAVFQHDECRNRTSKLNTGGTLLRMHLGKVGHKASTISRGGYEREITKGPCTDSGHKVGAGPLSPFDQ